MKQMYNGKALIKKRERGMSCTGEPGKDTYITERQKNGCMSVFGHIDFSASDHMSFFLPCIDEENQMARGGVWEKPLATARPT